MSRLSSDFVSFVTPYDKQKKGQGYEEICLFGISSVSAIVLSLLKKKCPKKLFRITFFIVLLLVAILISICGYFGGRLVYEYGIGIAE